MLQCCTQYASIFGKLSSGQRTEKGQFSFQSQRKAMPKNAQIPHIWTHLTCQQSNAQNSPSQDSTVHELPDVQAGFRKGRGNRYQTVDICWIIEKAREFQKKHLLLLHSLCRSQQTMEKSERDGNTRTHYLFPEKPVCRSRSSS